MRQFIHSERAQRVASKRFAQSVLSAGADTYVQYLTERGYAASTIERYFRSIVHFAHWLGAQRIILGDIDEELIDRFLNEHLPGCQCALRCWRASTMARAALGHLLVMLRASKQCAPQSTSSSIAITLELENFNRHLTDVCGLAPVTCSTRMRHLKHFLIDCFGTGPVQLSTLGVADMHRFMAHYTAEWTPASIRVVSTSLRSYFTFRGRKGEQTVHLIAALPQVAQWHLAGLPQQLTNDEIEQLLGAFDRRRATGRRDYAITRCLRPRDRPVLARWAAPDDSARAIYTPPSTGQRASRSGYRA